MADPLAQAVAAFLAASGTPADDPEIVGTPARVAALWRDNLLAGERITAADALGDLSPAPSEGVITLTNIPFHCVCPHHLLPAFGVVHLAYEPGEHIVGFGALERLVHARSRRLVLQETLTAELADAVMDHLGARGAACAIEATHLCLVLRGREPRAARAYTRIARGSLVGRSDVLPPVGR